jgi:hypothetical protein
MRNLLTLLVLFAGCVFAQARVFELRTYTCNEGKIEALKARFRDHTVQIFKRHNIESIGYWVPSDPAKKDTLVYIVAHPNKETADKNWDAFKKDPEWIKVKADSEANGALVQKVESVFMNPTDFSGLK